MVDWLCQLNKWMSWLCRQGCSCLRQPSCGRATAFVEVELQRKSQGGDGKGKPEAAQLKGCSHSSLHSSVSCLSPFIPHIIALYIHSPHHPFQSRQSIQGYKRQDRQGLMDCSSAGRSLVTSIVKSSREAWAVMCLK